MFKSIAEFFANLKFKYLLGKKLKKNQKDRDPYIYR